MSGGIMQRHRSLIMYKLSVDQQYKPFFAKGIYSIFYFAIVIMILLYYYYVHRPDMG